MKKPFVGGYPAAFLAVSIAWVVFAFPWLSGSVTIPDDAKAHFLPQLQFLANALHSGQSPFWTHNVFGGSPQIADPQSLIFSPAFLIAYFDPSPSFRQIDGYSFALLGLAAASVLLLFRDRGWHPAGATVAALVTAFGGSAIWRIQHLKQIEGFAFFVLCLWLLSRALERKSVVYGALAGFAAGLLVIEPGQIALLGIYILLGFVIYHWLTSEKRMASVRASLLPLTAGSVVAALFAAIPVSLTYLFVTASSRPEFEFKEAARGALHPASVLTAVVSDLYGAFDPIVDYWGPGSWEWTADWLSMSENMGQLYIGALPVLLLALGAGKLGLWSREIRFYFLAAAALFIFALGWYTPFFRPIFDYLPGISMFRRPADATYQLGAMAAVICGYIVHLLMTGTLVPSAQRKWLAGGVVGALFVASLCVAAARGHVDLALWPIAIAFACFASAAAFLWFMPKLTTSHASLVIPLLAAFMIADLRLNNGPNPSTGRTPAEYDMLRKDTRNATVAFLKANVRKSVPSTRRDRIELAGVGFAWPNCSLTHDFDHLLGYNPLRLEDVIEATGADEHIAEPRQRKFTPLFPSYSSTLANLLGLRYVASSVPIDQIDKRLRGSELSLVARTADAYIYENTRALPRVLFADDWKLANFTNLVKTGEWPEFDPTHTVLLDEAPPPIEAKTASAFSAASATGSVTLKPQSFASPISLTKPANVTPTITMKRYENTLVEINVNSAKGGFVVLNDVWHPWWTATVDGNRVDIQRANVLFRAVRVPPGSHVVRFEFAPLAGATHQVLDGLTGHTPGAKPAPAIPSAPSPESNATERRRVADKGREMHR